MGGIEFSVHPLFFVFGIYYALTGRIFIFIIYTTCAIIHELGHSLCANKNGYRLNKITLMPFGAIVHGNLSNIKLVDQVKIALSGPFVNFLIAIFFIATWWVFPESYAVTDLLVVANLSLCLVNLIPVSPLDGGRIVFSLIALKFGERKAEKITRWLGIVFSLILIGFFVLSIFLGATNISLLFFSLFAFFGAIDKNKSNRYVKIYSVINEQKLLNGVMVKRQAISKNTTLKRLISILDENSINEIQVVEDEKTIALLEQKDINNIMEKGDLYQKIGAYL